MKEFRKQRRSRRNEKIGTVARAGHNGTAIFCLAPKASDFRVFLRPGRRDGPRSEWGGTGVSQADLVASLPSPSGELGLSWSEVDIVRFPRGSLNGVAKVHCNGGALLLPRPYHPPLAYRHRCAASCLSLSVQHDQVATVLIHRSSLSGVNGLQMAFLQKKTTQLTRSSGD